MAGGVRRRGNPLLPFAAAENCFMDEVPGTVSLIPDPFAPSQALPFLISTPSRKRGIVQNCY
jgi:hypothetical protein